jgi:phthalate 4,5-dioxygenase
LDQSIRDAAADERLAEIRKTNELMTRTGPGTPMGDLLRRYWQPVALQSDLDAGDPVPLRIMSEDLVLFRDDQERVGLLGIKCSHRCADLSYGRVEHGGLRCVYHGWLFDVNGRCLQQPGEPGGGVHNDQIPHKAA